MEIRLGMRVIGLKNLWKYFSFMAKDTLLNFYVKHDGANKRSRDIFQTTIL